MSWITFKDGGLSKSGKTRVWRVRSNDSPPAAGDIGAVGWYGPWRKYCFFAAPNTVWEEDCLREIAAFCENQTKRHKTGEAPEDFDA